jgi:hypothetical protein
MSSGTFSPIQEEDAFDEVVGLFHGLDRLVVVALVQPAEPPVPGHAGMEEELVDRRELGAQGPVQGAHDFRITFHMQTPEV